jgi:hypothetical protein
MENSQSNSQGDLMANSQNLPKKKYHSPHKHWTTEVLILIHIALLSYNSL